MKKVFLFLMPLILFISGCTAPQETTPPMLSEPSTEAHPAQEAVYVKGVWLAYYELQQLLDGKDEQGFTLAMQQAFADIAAKGFNTVTVQVRPCADAFYPSQLFPSSQYAFGVQGAAMPFDPLAIICQAGTENGLRIEAWVNPYRVSQDNKPEALCEQHIARQWWQSEETRSRVYVNKKGIYFNPAAEGVCDLIANGVAEICRQYPIVGIHFDDYFYPTTDKAIDEAEYNAYRQNGGELSLADWRREIVSTMVKTVYQTVKRINPALQFGISPAADIGRDYGKLYADVQRWSQEEGFVDYICPQIYFGFRNVYQPFMATTKKWSRLAKCRLYVGLPLYKSNKTDKYAAEEDEAIINEFVENHNIIARQITYLSKIPEVQGYYVFSYSSLYEENCREETENMLSVMQSSSPQ